MNNKKRALLIAFIAVFVLILSFTLVACNSSLEEQIRDLQNKINGFESDFTQKSVTVYIGEDKFEITTRKAFLHDVLKDMKENLQISAYEYSGGELSPFFSKVGDLEQDYANYKYYSVWHSIDEYSLKSVYSGYMPGRGEQKIEGEGDYATTFVATVYQEKTLYYSNVGVGLLPIVDGATYAVLVD